MFLKSNQPLTKCNPVSGGACQEVRGEDGVNPKCSFQVSMGHPILGEDGGEGRSGVTPH